MTKRYIIAKKDEPEVYGAAYVESLEQLPGSELDLTPNIEGVNLKLREMTEEQAEMVASRNHVVSVSEDRRVWDLGTDFDQDARSYHQLNQAAQDGRRGAGTVVAVLDTGVRQDTVANAPLRVRAMQSFVSGEAVEDGNGHGDFCCVAATPPDGEVLVGKVLSNTGSGYTSGIIRGIAWALENGADAISMSLGGDYQDTSSYDPILRKCVESGVVVYAAAGNDGNNHFVNTPARSQYAYAVAAMDDSTGRVTSFSCTGPEVDFAGVGKNVYYRGKSWSGTSMACPIVCNSYLTILAETKGANRYERMQLAVKAMTATCKNLPDPPEYDGVGVPQVVDAVARLAPVQPAPEPAPPAPQPPAPEPPDPTKPRKTIYKSKIDNLSEKEMLAADFDAVNRRGERLMHCKGYGK